MKNFLLLALLVAVTHLGSAQVPKGRVVIETINAATLKNSAGENPVRSVTIYLPPGYAQSTARYPVIYFLHGYGSSDSVNIAKSHADQVMDKAINSGKIRPAILVMPNEHTQYGGSFYTNSSLTGNWADFTAQELVAFIDKKYRTLPAKESRGISGHSMGGHGALKLGMLFPDVFSSVYALSPALITPIKEFGPYGEAYKQAEQFASRADLLKAHNFYASVVVVLGQAYSPNPAKPPFFCDFPFTYQGDTLLTNERVLALWNKNSPLNMVDAYTDNLRKLKALKLDWGRNDDFPHIPVACHMFSQKVEGLGINHYAEEYIGTHGNKLWTDDGRVLNEMLPFFNTYLTFQPLPPTPAAGQKTSKHGR